jgi:hypothetical protein
MFKMKSIVVITLLLVAAVVHAQTGTTSTSTADISTLAWIAGYWSGSDRSLEMEEVWMAPKGNTMLGLHRDVKAGRTVSFEFLRIEATADGITYWASPRGKTATPFKLTDSRADYAAFENPQHDFPKKITYWIADGALHAKIEGPMNGKTVSEEWVWKKQ